ncbi:MAG TPA: helicase-related protein [Candidatus Hydrogenedentes bacterium]|nr:helicase-related protein [Candidatus Hydrogenedentota bacterium]
MIQLTTYMELVEKRFLLPSVVYAPAGSASLEGVKIRMGDYDQQDLERAFMEERLYTALFSEWKRVTGGRAQTMVFNVSQKHNNAVNDFFVKQGVRSVAIDDKTPLKERERLLEKFKEGPDADDYITVICSVMLFTEGTDSPFCKVALLNYSTKSPIKYFQSAMRAGRPVWEKDYSDWLRLLSGRYYKDKVVIIDLGGNTLTHGMVDFYDAMGFDMSGKRKNGVAPTKVCGECTRVVFASVRKCPHCGHEFPVNEKKDTKKYLDEVGLHELNGDRAFQKMILQMPMENILNAHPGYLRVISITKGYPSDWALKLCKERGIYDGSVPFSKWIAEQEKMKGITKVYERMSRGRLLK